jgi:hypothetical protein
MMMVAVGSFTACSHGANSGQGGAATTATTTTTTGAMGDCDAGASAMDCAACSNYPDCVRCEFNLHPSGEHDFLAITVCTACFACFNACGGAATVDAGLCSSPPGTTDPCDVGGTSNAACMQCTNCALLNGGSCTSYLNTCLANSECLALVAEEPGCPSN